MIRATLIVASIICGFEPAAAASDLPSAQCEREMVRASTTFGVPLAVLYAVGLTETGRRGSLQPFALNIEGKAIFARDLPDALAEFGRAQRSGAKLIDVGCMQVNHHYHASQFGSVADMFQPSRNVDYAAKFLRDLRTREASWTMAVARYHAGPHNNAAQRRYVCAVILNMVATGFGAWTNASTAFCNQSTDATLKTSVK